MTNKERDNIILWTYHWAKAAAYWSMPTEAFHDMEDEEQEESWKELYDEFTKQRLDEIKKQTEEN